MRREAVALALLLLAGAAHAQLDDEAPAAESIAPPPPALRTGGLIPLDVEGGTTLRYGVDPASVSISTDGIVRYVVVATSTMGAVNGMYEGVRCKTGEVIVYARYVPGAGWSPVQRPQWQPLTASRWPHSMAVARDGACIGRGPNQNAAAVIRDLRAPVDRRFGESTR